MTPLEIYEKKREGKEPKLGDFYELQQSMKEQAKRDEGLPIFGSGYIGNMVGGGASAFTRGFGGIADFVGLDSVGNALNNFADDIESRLPERKNAELSLDYILSPNGLLRGTAETAGSMGSILLPTFMVPGGVYATAGRILTAIPKVTQVMGNWAARGAMSGGLESMMEGGATKREALANGATPEEAEKQMFGTFAREC